jgi:purine-binding chemotaxis protein CheW
VRGGAAGAPADPVVELCAFRVGEDEYALDLRRIREVLTPVPVRPVPRAPEVLEGVVDVRGEVIPVVDARRRFGLPAAPGGPRSRILLVKLGDRVLAVLVDAVLEVMRVPRSAIRAAPPPAAGSPRLFVGACGGEAGHAAPGRPPRGSAPRLRLLLDVRALLEPIGPAELAADRARAAGESPPGDGPGGEAG